MMKVQSRNLGFLFVTLSGVGFGFLGVFGRLAFQSGLSVGELLTFRFFLAAALLFAGLLIFNPSLLKMAPRQVLISAALGVFGYAVFSTLYFKAIEGISVPLAALLLFTFPVFVNLGAHFILKERMKRTQVISLIVASTGLGFLLWGPLVVDSPAAVFCALLAAVTYAIYVLVSGLLQQDVPPLTSSLYVMLSAAFALYCFHQPSLEKLIQLSSLQMFLIAGIAVVSTIAPLTLFLAGLQRLSSSKASIVVMVEPVVAAIAASFLLNENLSPLQIVGSLLVITALVMNAFK